MRALSPIFWTGLLRVMLLLIEVEGIMKHEQPKKVSNKITDPKMESASHVAVTTVPIVLKKCCGENEYWSEVDKGCIPQENATHASRADAHDQLLNVNVRFAPNGLKKRLRSILPKTEIKYGSLPCRPYLTFMRWPANVSLYSNGSMNMPVMKSQSQAEKGRIILTLEEYCVDQTLIDGTFFTLFLACPCNRVTCVPKCCENHKTLSIKKYLAMDEELDCIKSNTTKTWNIPFKSVDDFHHLAGISYTLLPNHLRRCDEDHDPVRIDMNDNRNNAMLLLNGSLSASKAGSPFYGQQYCVDFSSHCGKTGLWALICVEKPSKSFMSSKNFVYVVLYAVGLLGLLGVLAVYALLPELRRPLNAKVLMNHAAALTAALVLLLVGNCLPQIDHYAYCATLAFLGQFFLLAAFFWLSVLCFDITRAFRDVMPISHFNTGIRRLVYYSLFGWCGPAVIVAVTIALNFAPALPCWVQRPEIGRERRCWFTGVRALFAYYYGPVASLQLANVIMFAYIMVRLRTIQSENASLKNNDGRFIGGALRKRRERVLLYTKLFSLMGVTWLLEVVTVVSGSETAEYVIDFVNVFRGVGLFVACCCKREVYDLLRKRLPRVQNWWPLISRHPGKGTSSDGTASTDIAMTSHKPTGCASNFRETGTDKKH